MRYSRQPGQLWKTRQPFSLKLLHSANQIEVLDKPLFSSEPAAIGGEKQPINHKQEKSHFTSTFHVYNSIFDIREERGLSAIVLIFTLPKCLQVRPIAAPTGRGSPSQANGGCEKRHRPRDVLTDASHSPHWPGMVNHSQWELRSAKAADAADTTSCLPSNDLIQYQECSKCQLPEQSRHRSSILPYVVIIFPSITRELKLVLQYLHLA
ncbi:hypothetical protein UY3_12002 [Chelonia mydas]|uniref:Uncharacterized protein n=1 Tax=Chelonia mydas TaxID=8469 RepID=M7B5S6_CHEMY|nr:hypothetical protein UY3_12002 [Chelonia mydas]